MFILFLFLIYFRDSFRLMTEEKLFRIYNRKDKIWPLNLQGIEAYSVSSTITKLHWLSPIFKCNLENVYCYSNLWCIYMYIYILSSMANGGVFQFHKHLIFFIYPFQNQCSCFPSLACWDWRSRELYCYLYPWCWCLWHHQKTAGSSFIDFMFFQ